MSDTRHPPPPGQVRPMTDADYSTPPPADAGASAPPDHPTRDLIVGAIVGAAALWAVPKLLDFATGAFGWGFGDDFGEDDTEELEIDG